MFRREFWLAILAASFNPLLSIPQTLPVKAPQAVALAGEALGPPIRQAEGVTETVVVPMVIEPWGGSPTPPAGVKNRRIHRIGHFPGFQEAKRKANEAQSKRLQVPQAVAAPPAEPRTASAGIVFDGPSESDTNFIPPDPVIAAGPSHVVVLINSLLAIYDKAGVQQGAFQDLSAFFGSLGISGEIYDPRVVYDQTDGRFILSAAEVDLTNFTNGHVMIAVSQTSDPTGAWNKFAIDFKGRNLANTANTFPDFPTLGLSSSAVYISTGQFVLNAGCLEGDYCSFSDTWVEVIGLSELLSGNPNLNITKFKNVKTASGAQAFVIQPAVTYEDSLQEFLVAADYSGNPSSKLNLFSINVSGTPTLAAADLSVPPFSIPPDAPQMYWTTRKIATNDFRLLNAVWSNNSLWCAHNVADQSGANSVARWYELDLPDLAAAAVKQSSEIAGVGSAYFPAVAVLADGTMEMAFTTSDLYHNASAAYTGRASSDPLNTMRPYGIYKAGTSTYQDFETRWGDYSGASLDPAGDSIWMIVEYASLPDPHFATAITQVTSPPALDISPPSLDFGGQDYGTTSPPQTLTLFNKGSNPLTVSDVSFVPGRSNGDFAIAADNCTGVPIPADGSCTVDVIFMASHTGVLTSSLQISFSSSGSPPSVTTVDMTGTAIAGIATLSPINVSFPETPIRTASAPQTVTLTNSGNAPLGISRIEIIVGEFTQTNNCPSTLAAGASCAIDVTFHPAPDAFWQGYLYVFTTAPGGPVSAYLSGSGVNAPLATVCPPRLSFPNQTVGTTSSPLTAYLSNTGTSTLNITGITASGDFAQTNTCGTSIAANTACAINITFTPTAAGTRSGTLSITDNAAGSPHTIALTGTGVVGAATILTGPSPPVIAKLEENTTGPAVGSPQGRATRAQARATQAYGKLPMRFEVNNGQVDERVRFLSPGKGYTLFLTDDEAVLMLRSRQSPGLRRVDSDLQKTTDVGRQTADQASLLRMKLAGANLNAKVVGMDELPGKTNYFIGSDPAKWRTNVPNYARVKYEDVYPGITLVYYGNERQLEYDFVVAPGADPHTIRLEIENGNSELEDRRPKIAANGDLLIETEGGEVRFHKPVVYQTQQSIVSGQLSIATNKGRRGTEKHKTTTHNREFVDGRYVLRTSQLTRQPSNPESRTPNPVYEIAFELGPYDETRPLVIDPVLTYSTFLGGSWWDKASAIAVDADGNAYIAGTTYSPDFPTVNALQATSPNLYQFQPDAFVAKLDPLGTTLLYSTYLGGSYSDEGRGIAVDGAGNAYITGITSSRDFPIIGGLQSDYHGGYYDAFVTKLDPTGSAIVYSTFLGGSDDDEAQAIALDSSGNAYVAGFTGSEDFPTTVGAVQSSYQRNQDAFISKLNSSGSPLVYSTFLGGSQGDGAYGLAVDAQGNAYVTGITNSVDFPATPGAFQTGSSGYGNTGFVTKLNPRGAALAYSSYLGSSRGGNGIAVDAAGSAYLTGEGYYGFPTFNAFQNNVAGDLYGDAFVSKFHPGGCALVYSTFLGGTSYDGGHSIAIDSAGRAYVTGYASSTDFPLANPIQYSNTPFQKAFVAEFNAAGNTLLFSTYFGGDAFDSYNPSQSGRGIAVDPQGNVYIAGETGSEDLPTLGAVQDKYGTNSDTFVAKISPADLPAVSLTRSNLDFGDQPVNSTSPSQTVILRNMGSSPLDIASIGTSGDFAQTNTCASSVSGGGSCTISITFSPTSAGSKTGTVTITDNASGSPHIISLIGNGIDAPYGALSTSLLDFGTVVLGTSVPPKTVTLTNTGNRPLNVTSVILESFTPDAFAQANDCVTSIAPGTYCTISVTFNPVVRGGVGASITVTDDAPNSPHVVTLRASVLSPPIARLQDAGLNVMFAFVGSSVNMGSALLVNDGDFPLTIDSITTTLEFSQTNDCPSSLDPQSYCYIHLAFVPQAAGLRTGGLIVTDNAADSPQTLALQGRGLDIVLSASPTSATVKAGESANYTLTVTPLGGFNWTVTVTLSCRGVPQRATCKLTPASLSVDGTHAATADVLLSTTAPSKGAPESLRIPPASWKVFGRHWLACLQWLIALVLLATWPIVRRKRRRAAWLTLAGIVLVLSFWASCGGGGGIGGGGGGGGGGHPGTPPGTYSLVITETFSTPTAGDVKREVTISLTVN